MERILYEVKKVVVGQDHFLERVLVAILAQGHLLVEGVPGLAKTLTVKTLAATIARQLSGASSSRRTSCRRTSSARASTTRRPASSRPRSARCSRNLLLADEINRAPAKVQSALLEVMQEHQVTIAGETHRVPEPFLVMATQNPIETGGHLPAARGAGRPLHDEGAGRLPERGGGVRDRRARDRRCARRRRRWRRPTELCGAAARVPQRLRRSRADPVRGAPRRRDARPGALRHQGLSPLSSPSARARARRSISSKARGRSPSCAGATTCCPRTSTDLAPDVLRHRLVLSYEALAEGSDAGRR